MWWMTFLLDWMFNFLWKWFVGDFASALKARTAVMRIRADAESTLRERTANWTAGNGECDSIDGRDY